MEVINKTKKKLFNNFDIKNMGDINVILGMKISRILNMITLPQPHYIDKVVERLKLYSIKKTNNSFLHHVILHKNTKNEK